MFAPWFPATTGSNITNTNYIDNGTNGDDNNDDNLDVAVSPEDVHTHPAVTTTSTTKKLKFLGITSPKDSSPGAYGAGYQFYLVQR